MSRITLYLGVISGSFIVACGSAGTDPFSGPAIGAASDTSSGATGGSSNGGSISGGSASGGSSAAGGVAGGSGGSTTTGAGGSGAADYPPCEPTLASIHDTIIQPLCTSRLCHGSGMPAATLDLGTMDWSGNLVGVSSSTCDGWARVVPGSPEQSFLYEKLAKDKPACDGDRMPGGEALPPQYIQCVADWITSLSQGGCEKCGGTDCVSLPTDASNCGSCGTVCPTGSTCQDGACSCSTGQSACGAACVDESVDSVNCGACGNACPTGASCSGGKCQCAGSLQMCGASCVDLTSDANHCGSCGNPCSSGQVCLSGSCSSGCGNLTQCGASCADLATSAANCGSCGNACASGLSCTAGKCACAAGTSLCGASCVDLQNDPKNCGSCGASCGPGSTCASGQCQCGATTVSFQKDVQPIFSGACTNAGCHTGARPKEGLSLDAGKAYGALVGVTATQCGGSRLRVKPSDVGGSYLMSKLLGADLCTGSQMPKAGQSLPASQLAVISDWICQGAPAN